MFVSIPGKQTLWTHTSLIEEQKANNIINLVNGVGSFQNKFTLFGTYLSLEAVNRVAPLKKLAFYYRAGIVAGVFLASRIGSASLYRASIQKQINTLADGAPVWENKKEVPELDKKFFFLDDDNNFQPSLWHHGINSIDKPHRFYKNE